MPYQLGVLLERRLRVELPRRHLGQRAVDLIAVGALLYALDSRLHLRNLAGELVGTCQQGRDLELGSQVVLAFTTWAGRPERGIWRRPSHDSRCLFQLADGFAGVGGIAAEEEGLAGTVTTE